MIKLYFGGGRLLFGLPPTRASLDAYLAMLDGTGLPWLVAVLGGDVTDGELARLAIERGGHLALASKTTTGPANRETRSSFGRSLPSPKPPDAPSPPRRTPPGYWAYRGSDR
jgi:hypothetical protein